jgi:hypothetical protein
MCLLMTVVVTLNIRSSMDFTQMIRGEKRIKYKTFFIWQHEKVTKGRTKTLNAFVRPLPEQLGSVSLLTSITLGLVYKFVRFFNASK